MLLQIIEDNFKERPVYFSRFAVPILYGGLEPYFQHCGLTYRLTPVKIEDTDKSYNYSKLEALLLPENFTDLPTIKTDDMPRASGPIYGYHDIFIRLATHYEQTNQTEKLEGLIEMYKSNIAVYF
jgi:hypothetical protein